MHARFFSEMCHVFVTYWNSLHYPLWHTALPARLMISIGSIPPESPLAQEDKGAGLQSKHIKGQAELAARQAFAADRWLPAGRQAQQMGRNYTFIPWYRARAPHNHGSNDGWMIITLTCTSG